MDKLMGWQSIETAPRDGTLILTAFCGDRIKVWWQQTTFMNDLTNEWDGFRKGVEPSHWMPLPNPPEA